MSRLRYYISGHGLGHASRSCQVLAALRSAAPDLALEVVTDAPGWFLADNLPPAVALRRARLDVGVAQSDSLRMQLDRTLQECRRLINAGPKRIAAEAASLQSSGVELVVADVPALACLAAAQAGCRAVLLSNFTWDWIYAGFTAENPDFAAVVDWHRQAYRQASLVLRLPFHGPMDCGPPVIDLPLVARRSRVPAARIRRRLGIREDQRVGLLSFGGFGLADIRLDRLDTGDQWTWFADREIAARIGSCRPLPAEVPYPDLVNAADAVITKPGYGIVAECLVHQTPVLYASRGAFREQQLLIEGLHRYGRAREIAREDLERGHWAEALAALPDLPAPRQLPATDGAEQAAARLLDLLDGRQPC